MAQVKAETPLKKIHRNVVAQNVTLAAIEAMAARVKNWGKWGPDDEIGTLNYVKPADLTAAAALVRTARKIFEGDLHLPDYVFSAGADATAASADRAVDHAITLVVPTVAGAGNDAVAAELVDRRHTGPGVQRQTKPPVDGRHDPHVTGAAEWVVRQEPVGDDVVGAGEGGVQRPVGQRPELGR